MVPDQSPSAQAVMSLPPLTLRIDRKLSSIRSLHLPSGDLNVCVSRNGTGKANLYRALALLQAPALGPMTRQSPKRAARPALSG